ncbi:MAG: hypothetical protein ACXVGB_12300, partial [Mycobacteriaceae bacterium]
PAHRPLSTHRRGRDDDLGVGHHADGLSDVEVVSCHLDVEDRALAHSLGQSCAVDIREGKPRTAGSEIEREGLGR